MMLIGYLIACVLFYCAMYFLDRYLTNKANERTSLSPEKRETMSLRYRLKIAENNAEHWKEMFEIASKELVKLKTNKK